MMSWLSLYVVWPCLTIPIIVTIPIIHQKMIDSEDFTTQSISQWFTEDEEFRLIF
jgi:hypothetical protein